MPSVITLSSYPHKGSYSGVHVRNQVQAISALSDFDVTVLAQFPTVPLLLRKVERYSGYLDIPMRWADEEVTVLKTPNFTPLPGVWAWRYVNGLLLYRSCIPIVADLLKHRDRGRAVLHSHWLAPRGIAGVLLARRFQLPHVLTLHHGAMVQETEASSIFRALVRRVLQMTSYVIAVSQPLHRLAQDIVGPSRSSLIPLGVPITQIRHLTTEELEKVRRLRQIRAHCEFCVLFVGANLRDKGFYHLFDAWQDLLQDGVPIYLWVAGLSESDHININRTVSDLGLSHYANIEGVLDWDELRLRYQVVDSYILPSVSEGFPVTLLEAAACGLALIATPVGGIPDFLQHEKNGLFVEYGSTSSIRDALTRLVQKPDEVREYGRRALECLTQDYDIAHNAERLARLYQALLQPGHAPTRQEV